MGLERLSSRAIIGEFYTTLEADAGMGWINDVSNYFTSDQDSETYPWLGMVPQMREWVGGRNAKGFSDNGITVANKHYEATIDILVKHLRRDKSGQAMVRIRELSQRTNSHWASLLSTLLLTGPSAVCYDGQFFFDTDHTEGSSGTQDNDISIDISLLPTQVHGTITVPSPEEMQLSILQAITQILAFKDDQGEPVNENAQKFRVVCAPSLYMAALKGVAMPVNSGVSEQKFPDGMQVSVSMNPRITAWTVSFAVFRADANTKAFIRQEETGVSLKAKAEGSEYEFDNDAWQFGVDSWRNVAFGDWRGACYVTMT